MFPRDYFAPTYFAPTYFATSAATPVASVYLAPSFFAPTYFAPTYFGSVVAAPTTPASDLRAALIALLRADATLSALTSNRIRVGWLAQKDVKPAITVTAVTNPRAQQLASPAGFAVARVQFDCWADSTADCVTMKSRIEQLLDGFSGLLSGLHIAYAHQVDEMDSLEWPNDGRGRALARIRVDYAIRHAVAVPDFSS